MGYLVDILEILEEELNQFNIMLYFSLVFKSLKIIFERIRLIYYCLLK